QKNATGRSLTKCRNRRFELSQLLPGVVTCQPHQISVSRRIKLPAGGSECRDPGQRAAQTLIVKTPVRTQRTVERRQRDGGFTAPEETVETASDGCDHFCPQ